jgi:N-acylglucosamine-6-phosphate 2-epimerase
MIDLRALRGGLIVSCQAQPGSPLRDVGIMVAMARAAAMAGAVGIRANGPEDVSAIHTAVRLPIIGIYKQDLPDFAVRITPTLAAARQIAAAGADILAVDATDRPHPDGLSGAQFIQACKREFGIPIMADISTVAEGIAAAKAGADIVSTTLSGYTPYSRQLNGPDFELIAELAAAVAVPVITEGRIATPADAQRALSLGAHAVVVGAAITRPEWITQRFVEGMHAVSGAFR